MHILFDIGRSKMRLAASNDLSSYSKETILDTPDTQEKATDLFVKTAEDIAGDSCASVTGGISRTVWGGGHTFSEDLMEKFSCPVTVENDTAVVGLGEVVHGAGWGGHIVVYVTVSSGVGGVRIVDGKIDVSTQGFEPGFQIIDIDGSACPDCGSKGYLEDYISGSALEKRLNKPPYEVFDEKIWEEHARFLAAGLNNMIVHWSPDVVVIGGSMMKDPGIDIDRVREQVKNVVDIFPELPEIRQAELGSVGGLYGALELARQVKHM